MHLYTHICIHICTIFENVSPNYLALFLKNNKQLYFQLHISEIQILCRHPKECYLMGEGWGKKEKSEHVLASWFERETGEGWSLMLVWSLVVCVLKLWLISTEEGNILLHIGLSTRVTSAHLAAGPWPDLLLCRSLLPIPFWIAARPVSLLWRSDPQYRGQRTTNQVSSSFANFGSWGTLFYLLAPMRHVWQGVPRSRPPHCLCSSFYRLSIFFANYLRSIFLLNLLSIIFL